FFQAEDGIRDKLVTGVQTCALPISTVNGVRHDEVVHDGSANGGSEAPAAGPWAGRGPDQREPYRGPDTQTAGESAPSGYQEPSSDRKSVVHQGEPIGSAGAGDSAVSSAVAEVSPASQGGAA